MSTVPQTITTVQFDTALRQMADRARTRYAGEAARIDRGLVIALNGGVTLHQDGTASVQSCSNAEVVYTVNGHCDCPDASRAPEGRCKHAFAKALVKKATALLAEQQAAQTYYATYYGPTSGWHPGQMQGSARYIPGAGWFFTAEDGHAFYTEAARLVLGGNVALLEAQRVADETAPGHVARICGYARTLATGLAVAVLAVGLCTASADARPRPAPAASVQEVAMVGTDTREYGVLILVNETMAARAVIDTGATSFYLPYDVYQRLAATGTVLTGDVLPKTTYTVVGGQTFTAQRIRVTLTLGAYRIPNVEATIGTPGGDILLGSSVLQRFQSFGIDHTRGILRLGQPR